MALKTNDQSGLCQLLLLQRETRVELHPSSNIFRTLQLYRQDHSTSILTAGAGAKGQVGDL